jgi:streptogramin lyase
VVHYSGGGALRFFFTGDHVRGAPPSVAAGLGSIWAIAYPPPTGTSVIWRIDPTSGSAKSIAVPFAPISVAVGENALWSVGTNGAVARLDGRGRIGQVIEATERGATQVTVGLHAVWILNPILGTVTRIDPQTNRVAATIEVGQGTTGIAVGEGSVWVTRTQPSAS